MPEAHEIRPVIRLRPSIRLRRAAVAALAVFLVAMGGGAARAEFETERVEMIRGIERHRDELAPVLGRLMIDARVRAAMRTVPRHEFVSDALKRHAYEDRALPIGLGQTISQPFIVALMTDLLRPRPQDVVLEVGTGSGYQAAVLAQLVRRVYTIEIVAPLAANAKERLARLGYQNVEVRAGDGYRGWPEAAPFDGIMVTAAADHIPPDLVRQLKRGGRMVMPLRDERGNEYLTLIEAGATGDIRTRRILPVRFVPLTRER